MALMDNNALQRFVEDAGAQVSGKSDTGHVHKYINGKRVIVSATAPTVNDEDIITLVCSNYVSPWDISLYYTTVGTHDLNPESEYYSEEITLYLSVTEGYGDTTFTVYVNGVAKTTVFHDESEGVYLNASGRVRNDHVLTYETLGITEAGSYTISVSDGELSASGTALTVVDTRETVAPFNVTASVGDASLSASYPQFRFTITLDSAPTGATEYESLYVNIYVDDVYQVGYGDGRALLPFSQDGDTYVASNIQMYFEWMADPPTAAGTYSIMFEVYDTDHEGVARYTTTLTVTA